MAIVTDGRQGGGAGQRKLCVAVGASGSSREHGRVGSGMCSIVYTGADGKEFRFVACRKLWTRYPLAPRHAPADGGLPGALGGLQSSVPRMAKIMPRILLTSLQRAMAVLVLVVLVLPLPVVAADHPPPELVDLVGERLEFRLKWQGISAADATLEVMGGDKGQILFRATARTVGLADFLYPVRSQIDSTVWIDGFRAERYVKTGQEGRGDEQDVEELVFDLDGGQAFLSEDGETREPVEVPADVKDPFSAFYAFRVGEPGPDGVLELTITDGKRVKAGQVRVVGRERVKTPAGTFDTVKIAPDIEGLGGVFKKSPGATLFIWVTDDEWRRPVMLRSKVSVGSFTARLTSWSHAGVHAQSTDTATQSD